MRASAAEIRQRFPAHIQENHDVMPLTLFKKFSVSSFTHIGNRKAQEDRITIVPNLVANREDCAFFGVFDGTVGDYASDNVKHLVVPHLIEAPEWSDTIRRLNQKEPVAASQEEKEIATQLDRAMRYMYRQSDAELIRMCAQAKKHYASTTSVTALMAGPYLVVAHLGDSRAALCMDQDGAVSAEFLTVDHKPDLPEERSRIEKNGGSVEYLQHHNNKPFIRGGDFTARKALGEQPMQLQYSRAFGGKDLKKYGLSSEPDVYVTRIAPEHRLLILASDGLWDVVTAPQAAKIAAQAEADGRDMAEALCHAALAEQQARQAHADNVTSVVVKFQH
eukprot:Filipodium_phascolosomae@DN4598_c0_g1_i1.p1